MVVTHAQVEQAARALDPDSWDAYDRLIGWEARTRNQMPVDGLDRLVSSSRSQAIRAFRAAGLALEGYADKRGTSDSAPTTYQVRELCKAAIAVNVGGSDKPEVEEAGKEFDRWFDAEGAKAEHRGAVRALRDAAQQVNQRDEYFPYHWLMQLADDEEKKGSGDHA